MEASEDHPKKCRSRSFDGSRPDTSTSAPPTRATRSRRSTGSSTSASGTRTPGLSDDEKLRIASEVLQGGKKISTVARENQVPESTLRGWLKRRRKLAISPGDDQRNETSAKRTRTSSLPEEPNTTTQVVQPSDSSVTDVGTPSAIDLEVASVLDSIRHGGRLLEELDCAEALTRLRDPIGPGHLQFNQTLYNPVSSGSSILVNIPGVQSPWSQRRSEPASPPATRCQLHPMVLRARAVENDKENDSQQQQPVDLVKRPGDEGESKTSPVSLGRKQAIESGLKLLGWLKKLQKDRDTRRVANAEGKLRVDGELVDQFQIMLDNIAKMDGNCDGSRSEVVRCSSCACCQRLRDQK